MKEAQQRSFLRIFGYSILYAIVLFVVSEMLVRFLGVAEHLYTEPAMQLSADGSYWTYQPGFNGQVLGPTVISIGPLGSRLHNKGVATDDSDGKVLIVGDSVTFGQTVDSDKTYAALLEKALHDAGKSVRVFNFGVAGHTLEMEVSHLRDLLPAINPDVIVLAFIADDLNPLRAMNSVDRYGYLTKTVFGPSNPVLDGIRAMLRNSHLVLLSKAAFLNVREQLTSREDSVSQNDSLKLAAPNQWQEEWLERFREAISDFDQLTTGKRRLVVCLDLDQSLLTREFAAIMRTDFAEIPYVDMFSSTMSLPPVSELIGKRDAHPNERAHLIYAQTIIPKVSDLLAQN